MCLPEQETHTKRRGRINIRPKRKHQINFGQDVWIGNDVLVMNNTYKRG